MCRRFAAGPTYTQNPKDRATFKGKIFAISGRTYEVQQGAVNDFEGMGVKWSHNDQYVLDYFKWHTPVYPVPESIKLHFNYTDWRDHFDSGRKITKALWYHPPKGQHNPFYVEREPQIT